MSKNPTALAPTGEFLLFQNADGTARVEVRLHDGTVWLTQKLMAELYETSQQNISQHLAAIYAEGELAPDVTIKNFLLVRTEGSREVRRPIEHYNLQAILAVGYRSNSAQGTRFRQWATSRLDEYLQKGFVMDDERLKSGSHLGTDYFDELLERIRDIRASERRFYQKITDIYAQCSIDYDSRDELTVNFFATVQNKLHWAIHGHTAAELVHARADSSQPNMGLKTWKNAPAGKIRRQDITVAKNYLTDEELRELGRIVSMYLDYADDQAPAPADAHGRLDRQARQLFAVQRAQRPDPRREDQPRARRDPGRGGVRALSNRRAPRRGDRADLGLRQAGPRDGRPRPHPPEARLAEIPVQTRRATVGDRYPAHANEDRTRSAAIAPGIRYRED